MNTILYTESIQAQSVTDSLYGVWLDKSNSDSVRAKSLSLYIDKGLLFPYPDSAFNYLDTLYDFAVEHDFYRLLAEARNSQGITFAIKGNYAKATDYFSEAAELGFTTHHDRVLSVALNNLGNIYKDLRENDLAIIYYQKSLDIKFKMGNTEGIGNSYLNIAGTYDNEGSYDSAEYYYEKALVEFNDINYISGKAMVYKNLGALENKKGNYETALEYTLRSLAIRDSIGDKKGITSSKTLLAGLYVELSDLPEHALEKDDFIRKAVQYGEEGMEIALEKGYAFEQQDGAKNLSLAYEKSGKYGPALEMHKHYLLMKDSISSKQAQSSALRAHFQYEHEKENSIAELSFQKDLEKQEAIAKQDQNRKKIVIAAVVLILILVVIFAIFVLKRLRISRKHNQIIKEQKQQVSEAFDILEEKNNEIMDSIAYAKRIQKAILPPDSEVASLLPNSFIHYKPKDVVAGDFYWLEQVGDDIFFAAADCTGHGVPGAMVSVICNNGLNRSVREHLLKEPSKILDNTRKLVIKEFEKSEEVVRDGMDIALCRIVSQSAGKVKLQYAGAHNPLWVVKSETEEIFEIKGDKQPIGKYSRNDPFTNHEVELNSGDRIYIFTDGFADQFGGEKGKKFKTANFKKLLLSLKDTAISEQGKILDVTIEKWRGDHEQIDDICVIGLEI